MIDMRESIAYQFLARHKSRMFQAVTAKAGLLGDRLAIFPGMSFAVAAFLYQRLIDHWS
jgi:hypothetical protein